MQDLHCWLKQDLPLRFIIHRYPLCATDYTGKNDPFLSACAMEQLHPIYRDAVCRHVATPKRIINEPAISMYTQNSRYEVPHHSPALHKAYISNWHHLLIISKKKIKNRGAQSSKRQFAVTKKFVHGPLIFVDT
jgi:hypothetical protein